VLGTALGDFEPRERWRVSHDSDRSYRTGVDPAAAVAAACGAAGEVVTIANACSASGYAVSVAADMIRAGEADVVLTGGAEGYSRVALGCFNRMGGVDPDHCRPFDTHRAGTVFGEGAGVLVLESASHARARGATHAYARLAGSGWSCDGHHLTAPEPSGGHILRAARHALAEAGVDAEAIGCVVPHGTGTRLNDVVESRVLADLLGPAAGATPLYSLKARVGHTGGAAGALAVLAAAMILDRGAVPPNGVLDEQDPECPVWLPHDGPVPLRGGHALVNAYAFGGNNVSVLLAAALPAGSGRVGAVA
jgi:3-oxoacyl-(acyl-carrier-protein) synthase